MPQLLNTLHPDTTNPLLNSDPSLTLHIQFKICTFADVEKGGFRHYYTFYCFTNHSFIMAKQTSLFGKISGKIGSVVFSTSGGETISREYNPHVANPNTSAQINQRARMKLMSQISAALAPSLAYTKDGLVSARNKFVKRNFDSTYALSGVAQCSYENLQLTEGNLGLPGITIQGTSAASGRTIGFGFLEEPSANISRVVWNVFQKSEEGKLNFVKSLIVSQRLVGQSYFGGSMENMPQGDLVIYAYGMIDTSESATARYGELNVITGSDLATLVATRAISFTDFQFTQTRGATLGADNQPVTPSEPGKIRVFVTALGNGGSVSGGGSFDAGTEVTVVATPNSGYTFVKWVYNGTELTASTSASYTFTLNQQVDLVAIFDGGGNDSI